MKIKYIYFVELLLIGILFSTTYSTAQDTTKIGINEGDTFSFITSITLGGDNNVAHGIIEGQNEFINGETLDLKIDTIHNDVYDI